MEQSTPSQPKMIRLLNQHIAANTDWMMTVRSCTLEDQVSISFDMYGPECSQETHSSCLLHRDVLPTLISSLSSDLDVWTVQLPLLECDILDGKLILSLDHGGEYDIEGFYFRVLLETKYGRVSSFVFLGDNKTTLHEAADKLKSFMEN